MKAFHAAALLAFALSSAPVAAGEKITVFKSPSCGCCEKWIEHLRRNDFEVRVENLEAMGAVKSRLGVPAQMHSCHTATVGGYVVEGHVPASDILRLLKEKPRVVGLAAPGMPASAPGMDAPTRQPYAVMSFTGGGAVAVFARH